jgi:hypothetical protein
VLGRLLQWRGRSHLGGAQAEHVAGQVRLRDLRVSIVALPSEELTWYSCPCSRSTGRRPVPRRLPAPQPLETGRAAQDYRRTLDRFVDTLPADWDVTQITSDDRRRSDRTRLAQGTQGTYYAHLNSFLEWLYQQQRICKNPPDHVRRPRRVASRTWMW